MQIEVLISCMHQTPDATIAHESALACDAVIINQCDMDNRISLDHLGYRVTMISTQERGLSRSRNMAIRNATADICVIADDDERFAPGHVHAIEEAYDSYPNADVILFQVDGRNKSYKTRPFQVSYIQALRFASWNITFRRESIVQKDIHFDEQMGSGTGNGSGEEIKFLFDCLRAGLRIQYVPVRLATLVDRGPSQWFHGFDARYFRNRGWSTARYMGKTIALLYGLYFVCFKYQLYKNDISLPHAYRELVTGIFEKRNG